MMPPTYAYRSRLIGFDAAGQLRHYPDGLLVTQPNLRGWQTVVAFGDFAALAHWCDAERNPDVQFTDWRGYLIAPGFVDCHIHYPQIDVIGSPAEGLLPWLTQYTFPQEAKFSNPEHAHETAEFFCDELIGHGVTTAMTFASSHPISVSSLFQAAHDRGMRLITGLVLQDQNCPDGVRDQTELSLIHSESLLQAWHGADRLGYAITPRFIPTSSVAQLRGAGHLAHQYPSCWIQSHVAENRDECAWVTQMYPKARSYLSVYDQFGLLRDRTILAHGLYLDEVDRLLLKQRDAAIAVCPTSNLFLGSGFFDDAKAQAMGFATGLASDVGGGTSLSPFHTMRTAYYVGRVGGDVKQSITLNPSQLWYQHTQGAAHALGLGSVVGGLQVGQEADFVLINPNATPLLARRCEATNHIEELLFALIILADDRAIAKVVLALDF